jgi:SAM-dependent methyltransferase
MNWTQLSSAIANDVFLANILVAGPIRTEQQERQLTALRRKALFGDAPAELLAHLAIQCFLNEYAWYVTEDEAERLAQLGDDPKSRLRRACYRRLEEANGGTDAIRAVERIQVHDVDYERRLAREVPALTPIAEGLSRDVQEMYEANPYPRWNSLAQPMPVEGPATILVVGCGTGRHALHTALRHPGATVLAVDLSRASLAYGMRKAREAGIGNIDWGQADLLRLTELDRTFDQVESVGTLPCMDDPGEGLAALAALLKPGGRLRLGLYSEAARRPLREAQVFGIGVLPTTEGIRAFRHRIMTAPSGDPLRGAVEFADFYATSSCRDLLLHVREHQHTIPQIAALLDANGLRFEAFDLGRPILERFGAEHDDKTNLSQWAAFEGRHPDTFRGMYQLWATKAAA